MFHELSPRLSEPGSGLESHMHSVLRRRASDHGAMLAVCWLKPEATTGDYFPFSDVHVVKRDR
jgi:hypothetical protein